jgi:hypothetical protein
MATITTVKSFIVQAPARLKLKIFFSSFAKQATLMRRATVLSLPPQLVFHESSDLLVLASSDQLVLKLKILFPSSAKQATLTRRSSVLSLPLI